MDRKGKLNTKCGKSLSSHGPILKVKPAIASDKEIVLPTDWVVTIVEPLKSVTQMYLDKSRSFKIEEKTDG